MSVRLALFMLITASGLCQERVLFVDQMVPPSYPPLAIMARIQGTVVVETELGRDGKVISAKATSAHLVIQKAAEENIRTWTFRINGSAAEFPVHHRVTYVYRLEGEPKYGVWDSDAVLLLRLPNRVEIVSPPEKVQWKQN